MSRTLKVTTLLLALLGFAAAYGAYHIGFERWPPVATLPDGATKYFQPKVIEGCLQSRVLRLFGDRPSRDRWEACREYLDDYRALGPFDLRYYAVAGILGFSLAALFAFALSVRFERSAPKVVRGPRLRSGRDALRVFARASRKECSVHGPGVAFLPSVPLSLDRETRHFLIWGSVGGGKTQTMLHLILEAISRGDGVLVLDTKGDMMAGLPAAREPLLIAPHDRRSLVWDVAADCDVKQDARELAARFIPPSSDPMWSEAAQEIFVTCLAHLQATKGADWGWADLQGVVTADGDALTAMAREHNPNALRTLSQPDNRTTQSILSTFQTHMNTVSVLAEAWADIPAGRFSIRQWLHDPTPHRPLILQHDPGYPALSRVWIGSVLGILASAVGSPSLTESSERRIWLFLDEFPQLTPIRQFQAFLELGRSKGVAVVIGAQDIAQLRATYGPEQAKSWSGMISTKIVTRINASEAAEEASRLIGNQDIERRVRSVTDSRGRSSVTRSVHRESRRVVTASEISSRLGPVMKGVRVLFVGLGKDIYELVMPYIALPRLREPTVPADWTHKPLPDLGKESNGGMPPTDTPPLSRDAADSIRRTKH